MKTNVVKKLFALLLAVVLCTALTACGQPAEEEGAEETKQNNAGAGGSITLPEGLEISTENNTLTSQLEGDALVGHVNMTTYRTSSYFYIVGNSLTVTGQFSLADKNGEPVKTKYTDLTIALWERGEADATYVSTAHFVADGTAQSYTFDGLKSGGEYRISITYTNRGGYYASGNFSVSAVSATGDEDATAAEE